MGEDILDWDLENWGESGINFFFGGGRAPKKSGGLWDKDVYCTSFSRSSLLSAILFLIFLIAVFRCVQSLQKGFVFKARLLFDSALPHLQVNACGSMPYKN
jgi:hypothetical protein